MPIDIAVIAFEEVCKAVIEAVAKRTSYLTEKPFTQLKIEQELKKSVLSVVESLEPFLNNEKISEPRRKLLIETCVQELQPLIKDPSRIFEGSLDGHKVVNQLYATKRPPAAIEEEGLSDPYFLLLPHIANLICSYPPAVKAWEVERYKEEFKRFDEITRILQDLASVIVSEKGSADDPLIKIRRSLAQSAEFELELSGLRPDRLITPGSFKDFFVLPALSRNLSSGATLTVEKESDILHALAGSRKRELIIGPPGSGKTTLAKWMRVRVLTDEAPRLAIVVSLRDLNDGKLPSLIQLVRESFGLHRAAEIKEEDVVKWRDEGRLTIICDGFDEVAPKHRDSMIQWINGLEEATEASSVIVTSRPLSTSHLSNLKSFSRRWEILPFDQTRIVEYINRWYEKSPLLRGDTPKPIARNLATHWRSDPTIGALTGNPLTLTTLLVVHHLDGRLPRGRAKLYGRYIEGMLGSWDEKRKVNDFGATVSLETKHRILTAIALHFHLKEVDMLDEDRLREVIERARRAHRINQSGEDLLTVLRERTGLLVGPGTYSFVHKSVAEFLVAQAVIQGNQRDESDETVDRYRLFEERDEDRWNTVLFFWAGLVGVADLERFIELALDVPGDSTFALVFGLLYDQIEGLSFEWARDILLKLLECGFQKSQLYLSPGWSPHDNRKPDAIGLFPNPRRVAFVHPDDALFALITACKLTWRDLANSHPSALPAVWLAIVGHATDLTEWESALKVNPRDLKLPANYYLFPLQRISSTILSEPTEFEIPTLIQIYQRCIPSQAGIVPFFLIAAFIDEMDAGLRSVDLSRSLTRLVDQILIQTEKTVDTEWLSKSKKMSTRSGTCDVLKGFAEKLDEAIGSGLLRDTEPVNLVRAWVLRLKENRDASLRY